MKFAQSALIVLLRGTLLGFEWIVATSSSTIVKILIFSPCEYLLALCPAVEDKPA